MRKEELSFQDKQRLMKHIASLYTREFVYLNYQNKYKVRENNENSGETYELVSFVNDVLESLTKEHKQILVNDFFHKKERSWWTEYYSKTTYYRIKSTAMYEFLHCLQ